MINESLKISEKKKKDCSTNVAETTGGAFGKKHRAVSLPHLKINSRWIKYLNVKKKVLKALEENIGKCFNNHVMDKVFLSMR